MLENHLIFALGLLFIVVLLIMISDKLGISSAIFLVIAGLAISLVPGVPSLRLEPELLFVLLLPPLLYRAAWNTCWKDFWANRRPISLHGFGLVLVSTVGVAFFTHLIIPNFSLSMGLLLGSILAPPDALAATSVLQKLKIPRRVVTILEGESLVNDAASIILFRFAVAAVVSGHFSWADAGSEFVLASITGIAIGCCIATAIYFVHRFLPTSPSIDTLVSLATPYIMYITADKFESSGVLAVVSGGFLLSYNSSKILSSQARLQMTGVWETLVFIMNGLIFIILGLQLPIIISKLGTISLVNAILLGIGISIVLMIVRMLWIFPATYLPRLLSRSLRDRDPYPDWRPVFLMGWCGMRGIVTLASALTIPLFLADQTRFPFRSLMLFEAFTIIIFTLVVQGLSLPYLIRFLGINAEDEKQREASELVKRLACVALSRIQEEYQEESTIYAPFVLQREKYEQLAHTAITPLLDYLTVETISINRYHQMKQDIIAVRRKELEMLRRRNVYSEELIRQKEFELDLEQISITLN
jgi:Na+/H+ antiporter